MKQVAAVLQVSTATVYELVRRGDMAHLRVLNAIRIAENTLAKFVGRSVGG